MVTAEKASYLIFQEKYIRPMPLDDAVNLYSTIGKRNAKFLFTWLHNIYKKVYLPCIDLDYADTLAIDKTKLTIFDVCIDDAADNYRVRNKELLYKLLKIPWNSYDNQFYNPDIYFETSKTLYLDVLSSIKSYPRYEELKDVFDYDLKQVLHSMEYSYLVNSKNGFGSYMESLLYVPHGLMVILHCVMDLMCSPKFKISELNNVHAVFTIAQKVMCIGNMLNTYPREIREKDISSPIMMLALEKGLYQYHDIKKNDFEIKVLPKIKKLEPHFQAMVPKYLNEIRKYKKKVHCFNVEEFVQALQYVYDMFIKRAQYWELA